MPNYDTPIGQLIHQWLKGEWNADTKTFELLQATDKQHAQSLISQWEREGYDILLVDRYLHSMWAYGAYDNDALWLQELTKYMRRPDATVYLEVEPEVSLHRRGKFGDNDYYESDLERLRYTRDEYECLFKEGDIPIYRVDANQPILITKVSVLRTAGQIYLEYFGTKDECTSNEVKAMQEALDQWDNGIRNVGRTSRYFSQE